MSADDGIGSRVETNLDAELMVAGGVVVIQEQGARVIGGVNDTYLPWPIKNALGWSTGNLYEAAEYIARMRKATQDKPLPAPVELAEHAQGFLLEIGEVVGLDYVKVGAQYSSVLEWMEEVRKRVAMFVKMNEDIQVFIARHTPKP